MYPWTLPWGACGAHALRRGQRIERLMSVACRPCSDRVTHRDELGANSNEPGVDTNLHVATRLGPNAFRHVGELTGANFASARRRAEHGSRRTLLLHDGPAVRARSEVDLLGPVQKRRARRRARCRGDPDAHRSRLDQHGRRASAPMGARCTSRARASKRACRFRRSRI